MKENKLILRKLMVFSFLIFILGMLLIICSSVFAEGEGEEISDEVYRLYNSSSSEHLYTVSESEVASLVNSGSWSEEGIGWESPNSGEPVYRVYSPQLQEHLYSTDPNEVETLCAQFGWTKDYNGEPLFYSGGEVPVYRLYNPVNGRHHLTTDESEYNILAAQGWQQEGQKLSCLSAFINPYFSESAVAQRILALKGEYPEGRPWSNSNYYFSEGLQDAGWGCHGFAFLASDAAFGNLPGRKHHDINNIRVGDILRVNSRNGTPDNHTIVITAINGDTFTIVEGNYNYSVHWDRQVNVNDLKISYIITRYPE